MNTSMPVKGKYFLREKAKEEMVEVESLAGGRLVTNSGTLVAAHMDTTVPSIILGDSQADVQPVAQHATIPLNAHVQ